jgi:ubiquinone/menaquinone biosynthesis C-methylase UbiE
MRPRRLLVIGGIAGLSATAAVLARPILGDLRRSFSTSSSPGAGSYDRVAGLFLGGYYDDIAADCAVALAGRDAPSILEVGPGPGHLAERLLALLPTARWTGLDVDPAMLERCERRLTAAGWDDRSSVVEADVAAMPFDDGVFDLVVTSLSAHHWPDAEAGFREIRRVLRPDGRALVYDLGSRWAHLETGHAGIDAARTAFEAPSERRFRGVGPWTIVRRAELVPALG